MGRQPPVKWETTLRPAPETVCIFRPNAVAAPSEAIVEPIATLPDPEPMEENPMAPGGLERRPARSNINATPGSRARAASPPVARRQVPRSRQQPTKNCQPLWEVLRQNAWAGRPCFVIGGGPSLEGFDWSRLDGELVIACNRAYEYCTPAVSCSMDSRYWSWVETDALDNPDAKPRFIEAPWIKCWLNTNNTPYPDDIVQLTVNPDGDHKWSEKMSHGLPGSNTGLFALALAACLDADPVYLLGIDLDEEGGEDGKQAHFHGGYPKKQPVSVNRKFRKAFEECAGEAKAGRRIINLNPNSALKCFDFGDIGDVARSRMPVVVAFYTEGTGYAGYAQKLRESVHKWGLRHDIVAVPDQGGWQRNTQYKTRFLEQMIEKHAPLPILYVDADATVDRFPEFVEGLEDDCDIAVHYRARPDRERRHAGARAEELLSGTIFLANNVKARAILREWQKRNAKEPQTWDQRTLEAVLDRPPTDAGPIRVVKLPAEYCAIYDKMPEAGDDPVITHWQASRELKREVGA